MKHLTKNQEAAFNRAKMLLDFYREVSPEHNNPNLNLSTVAGDLIADIQYAMSEVYDYPQGDVESVRIVALEGIRYDPI